MNMKRICLLLALAVLFVAPGISKAQVSPSPTPSQSTTDLQNRINELQAKITDLQGQEKTLSSQIAVMDSQINLTELRIDSTKRQISDLSLDIDTTTKKIGKVERSLDDLSKVLINRVVATYIAGSTSSFQTLLSSSDFTDFVKRANYLRIAQAHDRKLIFDTVQAKNDYTNQKTIYENKKTDAEKLQADLTTYSTQLEQEKSAKNRLLADTQGSEANYQVLLAQAKAQLAGFSGFTESQGGASILSNQTICDDWGCYYNQRDAQWGNNSLNGTGYTLASDGCLVTAVAMVYTHYGHGGVNPQTINSNSSNFASYYPAFLNKTVTADGVTSTRVGSVIDGELQAGRPVIVGIRYSNGNTHFVVLTDYNGGNYLMNDPYTENGHRISFSSKYSLANIFEIDAISGF